MDNTEQDPTKKLARELADELTKRAKSNYVPLWRSQGIKTESLDANGYPYTEADKHGAQSEAVKELFNFDRQKLPMRTVLNEKQINSMAMQMMQLAALDPDDPRPLVEVYMESLMVLALSNKGILRTQGLAVFQSMAEEQAVQDQFKP